MPENTETIDETVDTEQDPTPDAEQTDEPDADAETFPREYVEKLRAENGKYRQRASDRDSLADRLHRTIVQQTGRLADPTDLPFDEAHLTEPDALAAAIDKLLESKPHLASRKPAGDIGQGPSSAADTVSLSGLLRTNAS